MNKLRPLILLFVAMVTTAVVTAASLVPAPVTQPSPDSAPARPPAAGRIEALVTHGTPAGQFLAIVTRELKSNGSLLPVTTVRFRPVGGRAEDWRRYAQFDARVLAMAERRGDLVVLLETAGGDGAPTRTQLRYIHNDLEARSEAKDVGGPAAPDGVVLTDIAGGGGGGAALLALGRRAESGRLEVWSLDGLDWSQLAPLPDEAMTLHEAALDLGSVGGRAVLAARVGGEVVAWEHADSPQPEGDAGEWRPLGRVPIAAEEQFAVIGGLEAPAVMVYLFGPGDRIARLNARADDGRDEGRDATAGDPVPIEFRAPPGDTITTDTLDPRGAAMALGTVRLERAAERQTEGGGGAGVPVQVVLELALDATSLEPIGDGSASALSFPDVTPEEFRRTIIELLLFGLLVVALITVLRQRPLPAGEQYRDLVRDLAPMSGRAAAGLIDAVPLVLAGGLWWAGQGRISEATQWLILIGGIFVYFAHVVAAEAATGRSLGKAMLGLKVVKTDGTPAGATAILVRNLLRPLDAPVAGLGFAYLSPLRQRLGDMAAGTTVVRARPAPPREE